MSTAPTKPPRMRAAKKADPNHVSFGTLIAWSSSHASQAANFLVLGFFTIYCTDTLRLSPVIVGVLLLVSKIADAVGALVAGWVVDVAPETRFGKARPFDLAIVGIWIATAIMFSTPGSLGDVAKYVWVFVTYLLVTAVFTPLFLANQPLYLARAYSTREVYSKLSARSGLVIGFVALAAGVSVPLLVSSAGKSPSTWSLIAICMAVPLALFGLLRFLFIKEKHRTEPEHKDRLRLHDIGTVLRTNPYLWLVALIQFLAAVAGSVVVPAYYFRYVVGDIALMGVLGILNILALPVLAAIPYLIRKFSVSRLIAAAAVFTAIGYSMYFFAGANVVMLVIAALFTSIGSLPISFMIPVLIIDNATYNEWKGNRRLESVGGGVVAFAASVGAGVAAALTGLVLGMTGYNGAHSSQTPQATAGIVALMSWIPALLSLTIIVFALGYFRLERRLPTITAEVEVIRSAALAREGMVPVTADASAGLAEGIAEAGRGAAEQTRTDLEQDR